MDKTEPTEPAVPIPGHLLPSILEVLREAVRADSDLLGDDPDTEDVERVAEATDLWRAAEAGTLTASQTVAVADSAIAWIEPLWPKNLKDVDNVTTLLAEARELLELRDRAVEVASARGEDVDPDDQHGPNPMK
ncbi:MAG: hypothetical protein JWQ18_832 [Conexibacter sp.]|nr:hypothetical protein [Conexibacter sp.]